MYLTVKYHKQLGLKNTNPHREWVGVGKTYSESDKRHQRGGFNSSSSGVTTSTPTEWVPYLNQNSQVNQPPPLPIPKLLSTGSKLESLCPYLESWVIMLVATREKEPGQNLKECVDRGCEKKRHHVEKFGLNFFKIHK